MDRWSLLVFTVVMLASMVAYSATNEGVIFPFIFFTMVAVFSLPKILDLIREKYNPPSPKQEKSEKPEDWQNLRERLENLETLMCRLDSEINFQLERSLSGGRVVTTSSDVSQIPTTFLNVASALEGRYQILKELGRGGMGIVFQAHDKQLNEQVAIKIISPLLSNDVDALGRMKREVSAARRISHPNIIRIHDISELNGLHFVSMEYFLGTNLKELIRGSGALSQMQCTNIALQICDGMEAAHRQGIIHRDLKSQNIIINAMGDVKIIDFGLARTAQLEGMTATGLIMGTPEYMAPEQVAGKKVDERADIYAFGIILYELFTGHVPFTADSAIAVGFKQIKENPLPPREVNSQISEALQNVILKALNKDPFKRFSSVAEMKKELQAALPSQESVRSLASSERGSEPQKVRY
ncbi:serine/threonine protein kinase [bacterium]|nr:serine/threonine protein kinase [bacterium]MCI0606122.1 serine/threonine protein kinase [bacterium]